MVRLSWLVRLSISACLLLLSASIVFAQVTNPAEDQSAPIPGAGHDYLHLLTETVNPVDGSLSVRINVPIPKGRELTVPFAVTCDLVSRTGRRPILSTGNEVRSLSFEVTYSSR